MTEAQTAVVDKAENNPQANVGEANNQQKLDSATGDDATGQKASSSGEKQNNQVETKSPYDDEIARLKKLDEHKSDIIEKKNRALDAEKERRRRAEEALEKSKDYSLVEEESLGQKDNNLKDLVLGLREEIENLKQSSQAGKYEEEIARSISNPKEQEAVKLALKTRIKSSGNIVQDVRDARVLVNPSALFTAGKEAGHEEAKENALAGLSRAGSAGGKSDGTSSPDPLVADLLKRFNRPDAIKFIK